MYRICINMEYQNFGHFLVLLSLYLASTNSKQWEPFSLYIYNTTGYILHQ